MDVASPAMHSARGRRMALPRLHTATAAAANGEDMGLEAVPSPSAQCSDTPYALGRTSPLLLRLHRHCPPRSHLNTLSVVRLMRLVQRQTLPRRLAPLRIRPRIRVLQATCLPSPPNRPKSNDSSVRPPIRPRLQADFSIVNDTTPRRHIAHSLLPNGPPVVPYSTA